VRNKSRRRHQDEEVQDQGGLERRVAHGLSFLRRRLTGDYDVDDFGYDEELTDQVLMPALRPLYEKYFRVEVKGIENIPAEGGALIVANHSGTLPLDGVMMQIAVHDNHPRAATSGSSRRTSSSCSRWSTNSPARPVTRWPARRTPNGCWAAVSWSV
jgi:hypothetical protein